MLKCKPNSPNRKITLNNQCLKHQNNTQSFHKYSYSTERCTGVDCSLWLLSSNDSFQNYFKNTLVLFEAVCAEVIKLKKIKLL